MDYVTTTRFGRTTPAIFVVAMALSLPATGQERFSSPPAGIAFQPPSGWRSATLAEIQTNRERVRLSDPAWQAALARRSALPIAAFMKYEGSHVGLNPTVQVTLRQALAGTPTQILSQAIGQMRNAFPDLQIVSPIQPTQVSGLAAAHVRVSYALQTASGSRFDVVSRLWLVPRGSLMFLIGMSGSGSGLDECDDEFAAVLDSIEIQR